jgi:hypothetical protein
VEPPDALSRGTRSRPSTTTGTGMRRAWRRWR